MTSAAKAETKDTAAKAEFRAGVRAALKEGRHDEAKAMLDAAPKRWRGTYSMRLLRAEVLQACGDFAAALDDLRALHERFPDKNAAALAMLRLLLEKDRLLEARAVFETAVWTSAVSDEYKSQLIILLSTRHSNLDESERFLKRLLSASPSNLIVLTRLAVIQGRQGRWDEALSMFDEIAALGPVPEYARRIRADLLQARGRAAQSLAIARELAAANPHRVDHAHRLTLALTSSGAHGESAMVLRDAATKWPSDWRLLYRLNRCVPVTPLWDETFAIFESAFNPIRADARALFQFAVASLRQGKTEQSLAALDAIAQRGLVSTHAKPLQRILTRFSPEEWRARMRLADDPAAGVQIVDVDGADTTIIVFGGVDFGLSSLPFGYVDALFSGYRANVIYLRDFNFRVYFDGISSLAPTAGQTIDRLRDILERIGTRRLITIGYSVSGFAAVRYGVRLGAQTTITFGAPTTLEAEFEADSKAGVGFNPRGLKVALSFRLSDEEKDLVKDLAEAPSIRAFHYYAAEYPAEVAHADRFRHLGNVELRPLNISNHSVANYAIAENILDRVLVDEIGVPRA